MPCFLVLFKQEHLISVPSFLFLFAYFVLSFGSKQHVEQKDWQDADEFLMGFSFSFTYFITVFFFFYLRKRITQQREGDLLH